MNLRHNNDTQSINDLGQCKLSINLDNNKIHKRKSTKINIGFNYKKSVYKFRLFVYHELLYSSNVDMRIIYRIQNIF